MTKEEQIDRDIEQAWDEAMDSWQSAMDQGPPKLSTRQTLIVEKTGFRAVNYKNSGATSAVRSFAVQFYGCPYTTSEPTLDYGQISFLETGQVRAPIFQSKKGIYFDMDMAFLSPVMEQVNYPRLYVLYALASSGQAYAELAHPNFPAIQKSLISSAEIIEARRRRSWP